MKIVSTALLVIFTSCILAQPLIKVDQIGYLPNGNKIAVISDPQTGFNSNENYSTANDWQLINNDNQQVVWTGTPVRWNNGNTDNTSGDKAWRLDFSNYTVPGTYYLKELNASGQSDVFVIATDVYNPLLEIAFRTFYYQRCGVAKTSPYVENGYADDACHVGDNQDLACASATDSNDPTLDLHGGWHDAGDYNKYVNFAWGPVLDMLFSYEYHPDAWTDDMGIPESGNGIPDLLDEVKFELDWLLRMQQNDGGVLCVVGVRNFAGASPPSADQAQRLYGPRTTSATYSTAAMLALGAIQFKKINNNTAQSYANTLIAAAKNAWTWAQQNSNQTFFNSQNNLAAGEQETDDYNRSMRALSAAIFLSHLTGESAYSNYISANYQSAHLLQWTFAYPFEHPLQQVLLFYSKNPSPNTTISNAFLTAYESSLLNTGENIPAHTNDLDPYLAYTKESDVVWGSNRVKTDFGNMYIAYEHYGFGNGQDIADGYLHYMHGVNPMGLVYLTNLASLGAERSCNSIYHNWFDNGSVWDEVGISQYGPPPGFIPGGPNPGWSLDGCCNSNCGGSNGDCVTLNPPAGQPALKSYRDWNTSWPQNSWSVTENAIYYQASYLQLLASRVEAQTAVNPDDIMLSLEYDALDINTPLAGFILKDTDGSPYRIRVNNNGNMEVVDLNNTPNAGASIQGSMEIVGDNSFIILYNNSETFKLYVNNEEEIQVEIYNGSDFGLRHDMNDILLDANGAGILLKNGNDDVFKLIVSTNGVLQAVKQ